MRWMSSDARWVVDLVRRTGSGNGRDGEWLRVSHCGFKIGEAKDWDGVARLGVDIGDLRGELALAGSGPEAAPAGPLGSQYRAPWTTCG